MYLEREELSKEVMKSKSFRDLARRMGVQNSYQNIKKEVMKYGINFSHFMFGKTYEAAVGRKFGMLTVRKVMRSTSGGKSRCLAECACDCGGTKTTRLDSVKDGTYYSCGCHSKNRWNTVAGKNHAFVGVGEIRGTFFSDLKRNAKKRGLKFDITMKYLWDLYLKQNKECSLTGTPIFFGRIRRYQETTASLDRIDNEKGYVEGNLRWVLKDINMIRKDYDTEYFIRLCNLVANKHHRDV